MRTWVRGMRTEALIELHDRSMPEIKQLVSYISGVVCRHNKVAEELARRKRSAVCILKKKPGPWVISEILEEDKDALGEELPG